MAERILKVDSKVVVRYILGVNVSHAARLLWLLMVTDQMLESKETMGKLMGMSKRQIERALVELEAVKLVSRRQRWQAGLHGPGSIYYARTPDEASGAAFLGPVLDDIGNQMARRAPVQMDIADVRQASNGAANVVVEVHGYSGPPGSREEPFVEVEQQVSPPGAARLPPSFWAGVLEDKSPAHSAAGRLVDRTMAVMAKIGGMPTEEARAQAPFLVAQAVVEVVHPLVTETAVQALISDAVQKGGKFPPLPEPAANEPTAEDRRIALAADRRARRAFDERQKRRGLK